MSGADVRFPGAWIRRVAALCGMAILLGSPAARAVFERFQYEFLGGKWRSNWFQTPDRDRDMLPITARINAQLALREGLRVADIGAGRGYWSFRIARAVGPRGAVAALDIDPEMLAIVAERWRAMGLSNVQGRRVPRDSPQLAPESFDRILMVNTYAFWRGDEGATVAYLTEVRRALRPGGRFIFARDEPLTCDGPGRHTLLGCESPHAETLLSLAQRSGLRLAAIEAPQLFAGGDATMRGLLLVLVR